MAGEVIVAVEDIGDRNGYQEAVTGQLLPGKQADDVPGSNFAISRIQSAGSVVLSFECDLFRQREGRG